MKHKKDPPVDIGKRPQPTPPPPDTITLKKIGIQTHWDLDNFIEETEILLEVCKRLRDKRHHNRRCCQNCESLEETQPMLCCNECGDRTRLDIPHGFIGGSQCVNGDGKYQEIPGSIQRHCINSRMKKLMENPMEFDIEGDIRKFVCPFFAFGEDVTNIVNKTEQQNRRK
jgi:hypothetical protein